MSTDTITLPHPDRRVALFRRCVALLALAPLALSVNAASGPSGGPAVADPNAPAKLETIPGSPVKRITLTQKAAERLGIATGKVGMETVVRKQMVSGLVVPPLEKLPEPRPSGGSFGGGFGGLQQTAAPAEGQPMAAKLPSGGAWVLVSVSRLEWERLAKDKPARLYSLATRDPLVKEVAAQPSGIAPLEDLRRSMLSVYYVVPGADHGLKLNTRMRVELPLIGTDEKKKVAPYSAVYYDQKGDPWVYANTAPLVFERKPINVERIEGDLAVLIDGPEVGMPIVTTGAALLMGIEIFGK
jgi:hypothetical protein